MEHVYLFSLSIIQIAAVSHTFFVDFSIFSTFLSKKVQRNNHKNSMKNNIIHLM
uniref:Uncharacterized protein n=1 Tax=Anguilla anguilla TaxID=7936 RepID=A0A0E9WGB7_ANGAN